MSNIAVIMPWTAFVASVLLFAAARLIGWMVDGGSSPDLA